MLVSIARGVREEIELVWCAGIREVFGLDEMAPPVFVLSRIDLFCLASIVRRDPVVFSVCSVAVDLFDSWAPHTERRDGKNILRCSCVLMQSLSSISLSVCDLRVQLCIYSSDFVVPRGLAAAWRVRYG